MPSKKQNYSNVSIHTELIESIKDKIKKSKLGYKSVADYISQAIRDKLKE